MNQNNLTANGMWNNSYFCDFLKYNAIHYRCKPKFIWKLFKDLKMKVKMRLKFHIFLMYESYDLYMYVYNCTLHAFVSTIPVMLYARINRD